MKNLNTISNDLKLAGIESLKCLEGYCSSIFLLRRFRFILFTIFFTIVLYGCNSTWHPMGNPSRAIIETSIVFNEDLIAGGGPYIGRWNGTQWESMGNLNHLNALIEYNNELLAAGSFGLSRWDGNSWKSVSTDGHHEALTIYDGKLIAGGWSLSIDGMTVNRIAAWDGSQWHALGSGMLGRRNNIQGTGISIQALTVYNGDLIAGGSFHYAGGVEAPYIARWDGSQWYPMTGGGRNTGLNGTVISLVVYENELIAGGKFLKADGLSVNYIARWDGSQWRPFSTKGMNGPVQSLIVYNGDLVAGGEFTTSDDVITNSVARWNGSEWKPFGNGLFIAGRTTEVWTLSEYNGKLVAGGYILRADGKRINNIAIWDYGD